MRRLFALSVVFLSALLSGCADIPIRTQNYEIIVHYEVDGVERSASSVIQLVHRFQSLGGYGVNKAGVSPILDIGKHGHMAAAMTVYGRVKSTSAKLDGRKCIGTAIGGTWPFYGYGLLKPTEERSRAFDATPLFTLWFKEWRGKVDIPIERWPSFLWRPPGATSQEDFQFLLACRFQEVFGDAVKIRRITIEPTSKPLVTKLPDPPKWIVEYWEARNDLGSGYQLNGYISSRSTERLRMSVIEQPTQAQMRHEQSEMKYVREHWR